MYNSLNATPMNAKQHQYPRRPRYTSYGPGWAELSRRVRSRDNWTCQRCGWQAHGPERYYLHAHHIHARARGGTDTLSNLTSLCLYCHAQMPGHEGLRAQSDYQDFLAISPRETPTYVTGSFVSPHAPNSRHTTPPHSGEESAPHGRGGCLFMAGMWATLLAMGVWFLH